MATASIHDYKKRAVGDNRHELCFLHHKRADWAGLIIRRVALDVTQMSLGRYCLLASQNVT